MNEDKFNCKVNFSDAFTPENYTYFAKLIHAKMPFGKYSGCYLKNLPESYILWLRRENALTGELKLLIDMMYEIKLNGMENLLKIE